MKRILAGLALALSIAAPVSATAPVAPYLTLDTPAPYHYAQVITVTAHGDIPGSPGEKVAKTDILLGCFQNGKRVWTEVTYRIVAETPYQFHLAGLGLGRWDLNGGGPADCYVEFVLLRPDPIVYTRIDFHVEG